MKKYLLLLPFLAAFLACGKETPAVDYSKSLVFKGSVWVEYQGTTYENKDIEVWFTLSEDKTTADIQMNRIRFVPQMPVTVDTVLPVVVSGNGPSYTFSSDDVFPHSPAGAEQNKYRIYKLSGMVTGTMLSFSLFFGDYPTSFQGTIVN